MSLFLFFFIFVGRESCFGHRVFNCVILPILCPSWGYFDQGNGVFIYCKEETFGTFGPTINALLGICNSTTNTDADLHNVTSEYTAFSFHNTIAHERYLDLLSQAQDHMLQKLMPTSRHTLHQGHFLIPFRLSNGLIFSYQMGSVPDYSIELMNDQFPLSGSTIAAIIFVCLLFMLPPALWLYQKPSSHSAKTTQELSPS